MIPATTPRKMKVEGAERHDHAVEDGLNHVLSWYVDTPFLRPRTAFIVLNACHNLFLGLAQIAPDRLQLPVPSRDVLG